LAARPSARAEAGSGGAALPLGEPFARPALGLGNFTRAHLVGDVRPAQRRFLVALRSGKVEPLVGLDQVAGGSVATCGEGDPEVVISAFVALRRGRQALCQQQADNTVLRARDFGGSFDPDKLHGLPPDAG